MTNLARCTVKAIGLSLLLGCFVAEGAIAKALESTRSYGWDISAYSNEQTGAFSHCTAGVPYRSGIYLVFSINAAFNWSMGFANSAWRLTPGSRYPITYQIDNSTLFTAEAVAITPELASVSLTNSSALFELFRKGWLLRVRAAGDQFEFSLDNSSKALTAALNCAQRYVLAESQRGSSNPFVAPGTAQVNQLTNTAHLAAEAAAVTANVLATSGIPEFRLADTIDPQNRVFHAVWWAKDVMGGTIIADDETLDSAVTTLHAYASAGCKGSFASMKLPSNDAKAVRLKTVCEEANETPFVQYTNLIQRQKGGVYAFMIFQSSDLANGANILEDAGARFFEAAVQFAK